MWKIIKKWKIVKWINKFLKAYMKMEKTIIKFGDIEFKKKKKKKKKKKINIKDIFQWKL